MNKVTMILVLIIFLLVLRRILKFIYMKNLTPTMKFILAANATTSIHTFKTCIDINGYRYNIFARAYAKFLLKAGWGVTNREEALNMINWLFEEGHNSGFMDDLQFIKENPGFIPPEGKENHLDAVKIAIDKYPYNGILAWDLCRVLYVVGGAYLSGYFTYKESIKYSVQACKRLQENYSSWDDMMYSYLLGYGDWCEDISDKSRLNKYETLKSKKDGLYSISWNTKIDENDIIPRRIF